MNKNILGRCDFY